MLEHFSREEACATMKNSAIYSTIVNRIHERILFSAKRGRTYVYVSFDTTKDDGNIEARLTSIANFLRKEKYEVKEYNHISMILLKISWD